jgi:hypothetical protein
VKGEGEGCSSCRCGVCVRGVFASAEVLLLPLLMLPTALLADTLGDKLPHIFSN